MEAGVEDVTLRLYPGGRHEMHNETNREEVFQDLIDGAICGFRKNREYQRCGKEREHEIDRSAISAEGGGASVH